MRFWKWLVRNLSLIVVILLLLAVMSSLFWLIKDQPDVQAGSPNSIKQDSGAVVPMVLASPRALDATQMAYAKTAWTYFENNTDEVTGLAGSADRYPSTTMWETGSYLLAIAAADLLEIIDRDQAQARAGKALKSLAELELFEGNLPNKAYDIRTLKMVDYTNKPARDGLGWSALDIGRLLASLAIIRQNYPDLTDEIAALLEKWDLSRVVRQGELNGATLIDGQLRQYQEGRLGYEQYAATGLQQFGYEASKALDATSHHMFKYVEGVPVPVDSRLLGNRKPAMTTSESYLMGGMEFGFDTRTLYFASAVYQAQEMRYKNKGILTAVSEGHVTIEPYFAYGSVWGGGAPWSVMSFDGSRLDSLRTLSTKAAFGWDALFATDYTAKLVEAVVPLEITDRGWPEGIYERNKEVNTSITANTNAVVLEALAFRMIGPLKTK